MDRQLSAAARGGLSDVFGWRHEFRSDVLLLVGRYWLDLGQFTSEEREAMGAPLGSPEVEAFTAVVVGGMVDARSSKPSRKAWTL